MSILSQFKQSQNTDFPNVRPSLDLRFALAKKLDPRITFTRGSTGTYFGSDGIMRTAGVNEPRFDHDPITGQSLGLLIEESRSNLYKNNTFQNVVVGNPGTAPTNIYTFIAPSGISREIVSTGTENGITYIDIRYSGVTKTAGELSFGQSSTPVTGGQVVTASAYLKVVGGSFSNISSLTIRVLDYNGASYITESSSIAFSSYASGTTLQRYSHTRTTNASANSVIHSITLNGQSGVIDVTLRIGMPQLEVGSFTTSVIPTTANTTVTRSADLAYMTGTNFSSWYNQTEGTLYANAKSNSNSTIPTGLAALNNSSSPTTNRVDLRYSQSGSSQTTLNGVGGGGFSIARTSGFSLTNPKFIVSYSSQNVNFCVNSSLISSRASAFVPSPLVNRLLIGTFDAGITYYLNGTISRLTYYPIQLTNQQFINLTS